MTPPLKIFLFKKKKKKKKTCGCIYKKARDEVGFHRKEREEKW